MPPAAGCRGPARRRVPRLRPGSARAGAARARSSTPARVTSNTQGRSVNHCCGLPAEGRGGTLPPRLPSGVVTRHPPGRCRPAPRRPRRVVRLGGGFGRLGGPAEPARLLGGHLGLAELDQGLQGVGDRPGAVVEHLVDLVRGELLVRVLVQVGQHLVAQPAGPDSRGLPAAGRGLQRPPRLGGLLVDLVQARQHGLQVPARGQDQLGRVGGGPDLVEVPGQVRDEGRVRRVAGLAAGVRRGVLVVRGAAVVRVAARRGLGVLLVRDGVLVAVFSGGVVRLGLRRLRGGRSGGAGLGVVAGLWRGVAGLGGAVLPGTAGRLVFGGTVRAAGGVLTGLAGRARLRVCCRAGGSGAGSARVQVSGMPGLAPLTRVAVPSFSIASRAARAAGLPVPAASAMTATALPGLAASAA